VVPRLRDITKEASELLVQRGRALEALTLLGAFDAAGSEGREAFRAQRLYLSALLGKHQSPEGRTLRVPKRGGHYFLPARVPGQKVFESFLVDTGATHTVLPSQWLTDRGLFIAGSEAATQVELADGSRHAARRATLRSLDVGGVVLKNVAVLMCENCTPLLGQSTLDAFALSTFRSGGLTFLTLKAH
jgi:clan AA aspartic protease (TIGR02281 family)